MFAIDSCTSVLTIGIESVTIEMSLEEYNWGKSDRPYDINHCYMT